MSWRASDDAIGWANQVIRANKTLPVILVNHQLVGIGSDGEDCSRYRLFELHVGQAHQGQRPDLHGGRVATTAAPARARRRIPVAAVSAEILFDFQYRLAV